MAACFVRWIVGNGIRELGYISSFHDTAGPTGDRRRMEFLYVFHPQGCCDRTYKTYMR